MSGDITLGKATKNGRKKARIRQAGGKRIRIWAKRSGKKSYRVTSSTVMIWNGGLSRRREEHLSNGSIRYTFRFIHPPDTRTVEQVMEAPRTFKLPPELAKVMSRPTPKALHAAL